MKNRQGRFLALQERCVEFNPKALAGKKRSMT